VLPLCRFPHQLFVADAGQEFHAVFGFLGRHATSAWPCSGNMSTPNKQPHVYSPAGRGVLRMALTPREVVHSVAVFS
jgi:hypothetical protein